MKTEFPTKSKVYEEQIRLVAEKIKQIGKNKIAYIILFGSFARGNWVDDIRVENDGTVTTYNSDYDFLILTRKHVDGSGAKGRNFERDISKKLNKGDPRTTRTVTIIVESLNKVNNDLKKGQYFFSDIKKEGILLYRAETVKDLADAKKLTETETRKISKDYFEEYFKRSEEFVENYKFNLEKKYNELSAFMLHQATERFFYCTELVFTHYKPKIHDLKRLRKRCSVFDKRFADIFPTETKEQQVCFDLLVRAYIEARYDRNYTINRQQLEYLAERISNLSKLVKEVCLNKINSF